MNIDVEEFLGDWVTLELFDDREHLAAVEFELDERSSGALLAHEVTEIFLVHSHTVRAGWAINNGGDRAIDTQTAGVTTAVVLTTSDGETELLHNCV